jgi:hypothetical protein
MRPLRGLVASAALLALAVSVSAQDFQNQVTLTHASSALNGFGVVGYNGVAVGPYTGSVPGLPSLDLYCVDFYNSVHVGDSWKANFTSMSTLMGGSGFGSTRLGQLTLPPAPTLGQATAVMKYQRAVWLATQFAANGTGQWGGIHGAIWDITAPPGSTGPQWAAATVWKSQTPDFSAINWDYWYVVTDVATAGGLGGKQEYLAYITPEPGTILLLASGLIGLAGAAVVTRRAV